MPGPFRPDGIRYRYARIRGFQPLAVLRHLVDGYRFDEVRLDRARGLILIMEWPA